jgi:hypothetical protein
MSADDATPAGRDAVGSAQDPAAAEAPASEKGPVRGKGPSLGKAREAALDDDADSEREYREQLSDTVNNWDSVTNYTNNIHFNAPVDLSGGVVGTSVGAGQGTLARRSRTGRLPDDEVSVLCERFAEPAPFLAAAGALDRDQVVVLTGVSGLGKTASAVCLLRSVDAGELDIVSPTITLEELSKHDFEPGHGYLVEDWQDTRGANAASDFQWRVLRDHVKDSQVHLVVITAAAKAARSVSHFRWEAPSVKRVLAAYLAGTDAEDVAAGIAPVIPAAYGVGQVASIGRRLAAGEDQSTIRKELSEDPARHVRQWLSAENRPDKEIEEVVALGFAAGQTERIFDVMLDRLDNTLRDVGLVAVPENDKGDKEDTEERGGPRPTGLRRVRAERVRADGLFERKRDNSGGTSRDIMDFKGDEQQRIAYRQHVLEQLWRDFDMTFWRAIRGWLAELISDTMVTLFRDATLQMSVAAGLALLARVAPDEVEESYLHPWASGELGWSGQQTAVYTLWWMARESSLAPVALRVATSWVNSGDPSAQWTAAAALSGELGAGYPVEAARRLWHLVGQSKEVRPDAIFALANLFATLTREGEDASQVLELLKDRLSRVSGQGAGDGDDGQLRRNPQDDRRIRERVMLSILAVLIVRDPRTGQSSVSSFLDARPEHRSLVAELWAEVLRNRVYRRSALTALLEAVHGFKYVSDDPEAAAHALGDALSAALPVVEHKPFKADFTNLHAHSKRNKSLSAATIHALLSALEELNIAKREAK